MIVDSNAAAPLKYTDPTFQTLLFIRANIYDTSGGSPSLASTVNLALITQGTYYGKFTFTAGKTYLVQKLVYTDGTYATVDQNYAQDNDDVQCVDLKIANLDAAISTRNSTAHFDAIMGTPAGASIAADLAEIEVETDGIALIPTNPLLTTDSRLNNLDATVSSRATQTSVNAIPTNPLLTTDSRLNNLDATISSRLATAGYVAPDNADIVAIKTKTDQLNFTGTNVNANALVTVNDSNILAIKTKTDNLPADPASNTQVNTRNSTAHFDAVIGTPAGASVSADIAEIEAETDGIAAIPTNPLLTNDSRLNNLDTTISSREPSSDPRLANLDATVSSRLPTSSYVAPDNADVVAIKAKTDQLLFDVDTGVKAHTLNAGGAAPTVSQIVNGVWDELIASHLSAGSTGEKLNGAGGGGGSSSGFGIAEALAIQPNIVAVEAVQPQFVEAIALENLD